MFYFNQISQSPELTHKFPHISSHTAKKSGFLDDICRHLQGKFLAEIPPVIDLTARAEQKTRNLLADIAKDEDISLNKQEFEIVWQQIMNDILGLGPLEELLTDDSIVEINVMSHDNCYVSYNDGQERFSHVRFDNRDHYYRILDRIFGNVITRQTSSLLTTHWQNKATMTCVFNHENGNEHILIIRKNPQSS